MGNMGYDKTTDTYTCHARKALKPLSIKKQKIINGYESEVTVYERKDSHNPAQIFAIRSFFCEKWLLAHL